MTGEKWSYFLFYFIFKYVGSLCEVSFLTHQHSDKFGKVDFFFVKETKRLIWRSYARLLDVILSDVMEETAWCRVVIVQTIILI